MSRIVFNLCKNSNEYLFYRFSGLSGKTCFGWLEDFMQDRRGGGPFLRDPLLYRLLPELVSIDLMMVKIMRVYNSNVRLDFCRIKAER
jgi:hypothetical protein